MMTIFSWLKNRISIEQIFMISVLLVNGGNYFYNLILGRLLGPKKFADAAILVTFMLVLSFIAMTFQLVTAKFSVIFEERVLKSFTTKCYKIALATGVILGIMIMYFSIELQSFFNTSSSDMFVVFGVGVPFYFVMSVNRGGFQGKKELISLSITYQLEMISRLVITVGLLYFLKETSSFIIAIGILCSFIVGLIPFRLKNISFSNLIRLEKPQLKMVRSFFLITAFYEVTQIIINNSDILLVKHYFESYEAGLYASLALIGRVVYFIAWMFVMLLLPSVVQLKKEGKATSPILLKYVSYIAIIAAIIILGCYFFPKYIILILFGNSYLEIASLLWKYALATGIFAVSNIFAYYYLSLDKYIPVILSGVLGMLQVVLIVFFHVSIEQVVEVQIYTMVLLLITQLIYFFLSGTKIIKT